MSERVAPATRQWLSKRQSATVEALVAAGMELLRERGYDGFGLRDVAARAGVTHTTVYSYFSSKDHLIAEAHWRALQAAPAPSPDLDAPLHERLATALRGASVAVAGEPRVAEGILAALMSRDPDIARIRDAVGAELTQRIARALGPDIDPRIADGTLLLFSGAMLQAGLGYFAFEEVVERLGAVASMWEAAVSDDERPARRSKGRPTRALRRTATSARRR
jgi:AcrR family transcriptional regulator